MIISKLSAGMTVYEVKRKKCGPTTTIVVRPVQILKLLPGRVQVSYSGGEPVILPITTCSSWRVRAPKVVDTSPGQFSLAGRYTHHGKSLQSIARSVTP